jgi:organic hydroperoxide reductase OsmC/OhrA
MDEIHLFRVVAWWSAEHTGLAKCNSAPTAIHFASPVAFGGLKGRWTPEELLLCSIAGCFTTTFRTLAEGSKFDFADLQVEAEALVNKAEAGYVIGEIVIRPHLMIHSEEYRKTGFLVLRKTGALCLVLRALAVSTKIRPRVDVGKPGPLP